MLWLLLVGRKSLRPMRYWALKGQIMIIDDEDDDDDDDEDDEDDDDDDDRGCFIFIIMMFRSYQFFF